ncbi:MAG: DUF2341 domain-containing protein [Acidobacteriaceae bacterium]|nr:DUF2341 domain-containing protein [Acidobacteriaceae bacterium]
MSKNLAILVFSGSLILTSHLPAQSYVQGECPAGVANGVNVAFTLKNSPQNGSVALYKNGVRLQQGLDYSLSANSIQFSNSAAPQSTDTLLVDYMAAPASSNGYSYSRRLTLSHAQVPNTDQSNFTVLMSGTYPSLATAANGGHVQNANGYDIIFASDATAQNPLKWEFESYNPVSGAISAWVQVPTLSHSVDTVIYMLYGNASVSTFQGGAAGAAWDSYYAGVWHFPNGSVLSTGDSTNQITLKNNGAAATSGQIGGALLLNNVSSGRYGYDLEAAVTALANSGSKTFEAWINPSAFHTNASQYTGLVTYGKGGNVIYSLSLVGSGKSTNATPRFEVQNSSGSYQNASANALSATGTWSHIVGVVASPTIYIYVNGVQHSAAFSGMPAAGASTFALSIGRDFYDNNNPPARWFDGAIDEVRLSTMARSADWIATEYNNQSSPGTFYGVGPEQASTAVVH